MQFAPQNLRALREDYGLTPSEMSRLLCVSRPTIYAWEGGRTGPSPVYRVILSRMDRARARDDLYARTLRSIHRNLKSPAGSAFGLEGFLEDLFSPEAR
jgi:transcriptional regulator with XRE-family HTH domain